MNVFVSYFVYGWEKGNMKIKYHRTGQSCARDEQYIIIMCTIKLQVKIYGIIQNDYWILYYTYNKFD